MESATTSSKQAPVYAGFWRRLAASVIDTLLLTPLVLLLLRAVYGPDAGANATGQQLAMLQKILQTGVLPDPEALAAVAALSESAGSTGLADPLISYGLPAVLIIGFWLWRRGTPGKLWLGMQVVDAQTLGPLRVGQSIGRYLGYFVSLIPLGLGMFWIGLDARKQGWHDKLASTVVIRKPLDTP